MVSDLGATGVHNKFYTISKDPQLQIKISYVQTLSLISRSELIKCEI